MITRLLYVGVAVAALCLAAAAATELWRYKVDGEIYQIVADGRGGGAIAWEDTNSNAYITWLDKRGAVIYENALSNKIGSQILMCSPKWLLYADERPEGIIVQRDRKGGETILAAPNGDVSGSFLSVLPRNTIVDRKGFFGVLLTMSTSEQALLRFKNK